MSHDPSTSRAYRRAILAGTIVGTLFGAGAAPAFAVYRYSNVTNFSSNGTNYSNYSGIDDLYVYADTTVDRISAGNTAAGRMGARVRVYYGNGDICWSTPTSFNNVSTRHWYNSSPYHFATSGVCTGDGQAYVFSKGATETYNANGGFNFDSTARTVNVPNN
jgi:hypothetical protein